PIPTSSSLQLPAAPAAKALDDEDVGEPVDAEEQMTVEACGVEASETVEVTEMAAEQ
ncbi:unnamed protein product, partial [Symbiodinium pilosum]